MPQCFTPSQLLVSHWCRRCWICYCYLWFSAASCLRVAIHNSCFYICVYSESVSPPFFILHRWQLRDILVLSHHSSWQGHVCGKPCVSPPLTRKGKVLETCEDALVGVWFPEQCWSDVIKTMVLLEALTFCTGGFNKREEIYKIWHYHLSNLAKPETMISFRRKACNYSVKVHQLGEPKGTILCL